ncbi:MAG: hypothetical protein ACOYB3_05565 [Azonexus sp.]
MTQRLFQAGDLVRVRAAAHDDWSGLATVARDQRCGDPLVDFVKDIRTPGTGRTGFCHWRWLDLIAARPDSEPVP